MSKSTENQTSLNSLSEKRNDAGNLIKEVLEKVPENRKGELLGVINGFVLGVGGGKVLSRQ